MEQLHIVCPHCNTVNRVASERIEQAAKCGKCKNPLFSGRPLELDDSNFDRNLSRNDIPLIIDFWAPWCGPCKMMTPAYAQATARLEPHFRLAKLNTEKEQAIAARFGIRSIPTLIAFKKGKEIARQSGAMSGGDIVRWIRSVV